MPEVNIALDIFGIITTLIIFFSCLEERVKKETKSNSFLLLMATIILALIADVFGWIGEGNTALSVMTVVGNTVAACLGYLAIFFFILYLKENLYRRSPAARAIVIIFAVVCVASIIMVSLNCYHGTSYHIDGEGHFVHGADKVLMMTHLLFPLLSFLTIFLMVLTAKGISARDRLIYLSYAVFPAAGVIFDYTVHGWSLTYIGLVISTMIIYTSIYLQKRRLIQEQRTALMMSQINPHFMYNTLTTIASLCEIDPRQAKTLTIEFSSFLRQNLDTMTSSELIPFEQELRHVGCYLKIEKARFKDKVNVVYSIDCKNFAVPALTIQPLVENAVKHGITKKRGGGTVKISTYHKEKSYVIEIKDDGVGFDTEMVLANNDRIGINNVRSRLKEMCGGTVEIKSMVGVGTRITVEIPDNKRNRL